MKTYEVLVNDSALTFSSAHFITFANGECEALHGHDFRVGVRVTGEVLPDGGYVLDFMQLHRAIREILRKLDHKILLPGENPHWILAVREKVPEEMASMQNWIAKVGNWLTQVNEYDHLPENDSKEEILERERELEHHLARELGLPPDPQEQHAPHSADILETLQAEVEIRYLHRRWIFPEEDCEILPMENTTAERLAEYIAQELCQKPLLTAPSLQEIEVRIEESTGMTGIFRSSLPLA